MRVKWTEDVLNEDYEKLADEITALWELPGHRAILGRQPRTVPEAELKNKWAAMEKEKDKMEESHEEVRVGEVVDTIVMNGSPKFVVCFKGCFEMVSIRECTEVEEKK